MNTSSTSVLLSHVNLFWVEESKRNYVKTAAFVKHVV
jgi:hypothetical protein